MRPKDFNDLAEKLKAISHPARLCIVCGLMDHPCNVTDMHHCLEMPQSTLSQHLSKLRAAGIIKGERKGAEIRYSLSDEKVRQLMTLFVT